MSISGEELWIVWFNWISGIGVGIDGVLGIIPTHSSLGALDELGWSWAFREFREWSGMSLDCTGVILDVSGCFQRLLNVSVGF